MAASIRAKLLRQRKAAAAVSSTRHELDIEDLFQSDAPQLFTNHTIRVSASMRRKRTESTAVELPSPMKQKRPRRQSTSIIDTSTFSLEEDFYPRDFGDAQDPKEKRVRPSVCLSLCPFLCIKLNEFDRILPCSAGSPNTATSSFAPCFGTTVGGTRSRKPVLAVASTGVRLATDARTAAPRSCFAVNAASKHTGNFLLHWIQEWDPRRFHFSPKSLKQLGLRVQVGHSTLDDHCSRPRQAREDFIILHDNGLHHVALDYCGCDRVEEDHLQLLRSRFFPATTQRIQTCATFACLDRFHAFSLKPKTNGFDFFDTLERLTNGAGEKSPDRYRMLLRMGREWRHLLLLKRGGRFGYQSNQAEDAAPGELAILCPACPRPGVNLPEDWKDAKPEDEHLYAQFFAMDACFQLKRRMVSSEARDPALGPGFAFMVESRPYREYLRTATNDQEMSTCSGLKALEQANSKFSKGYAATGVGMLVCARHELVQPTSVGDLQKGERYSNMDYLFAAMLRHVNRFLRKVVSYDIVCQWNKNLFKRLAGLPGSLKVVLLREWTKFAVPKMHILGHTLKCKGEYDLNFIPGSGQTDAEGIERAWAAAGGLSGSTRMMGPGARSDMLDAYWSFWNWTKVLGLPGRFDNVSTPQNSNWRSSRKLSLSSRRSRPLVPSWRKLVEKFEANSQEKNPYIPETTGEFLYPRLSKSKKTNKHSKVAPLLRVHDVGPAGFLEFALATTSKAQAALKKSRSTAEQIKLGSSRRKLNRDIQTLRTLQATFTPDALTKLAALSLPETTVAEELPLLLPSALAASWVASADPTHGLDSHLLQLLAMEREHRCAQMGYALAHVRNHLHIRKRLRVNKDLHVRHQAANTRALAVRARNESQLSYFADLYQIAWFAVLQIEGGDESKVGFTRLKREDIRYMDEPEVLSKKAEKERERKERQERRRAQIREEEGWSEDEAPMELDNRDPEDDEDEFFMKGSNKHVMSWIWRGTQAGGSEAEMAEAVRIEWSKAWARLRRWEEEVGFLTHETRRVPTSHEHWAAAWEERARSVPLANMHRKLAQRAAAIATEHRLGRGRRRVRVVAAPDLIFAMGDSQVELEDKEDEEEEDETELEELEDRGDLDSDDDSW
ncbi:CxC2 domain-containing protein [Mycena chlorophos]|uniref:CxC2 domain-containing protein n=1 Tax=Mycena chlorophos TaxID=658473 RepID=A0A8H6SD85_MYCCL|nr:CxC2 domain-containing protein [Mycena chlorophos]